MMNSYAFQEQMARAYAEVGLMYSERGAKAAAEYVNEKVKPLVDEFYDQDAGSGSGSYQSRRLGL